VKQQVAEILSRAVEQPALAACRTQIVEAFELLEACFAVGGKLLVCGNGGSAADSEHIVGELMKGFASRRPVPAELSRRLEEAYPGGDGRLLGERLQGALPAISLVSQTSLATALANDVAAEMVFAQQVYGYGRPADLLLAISTSGNAANVIAALRVARVLGLKTIALTGRDGGRMGKLADVVLRVPAAGTPEVQVLHLQVYHCLCAMLEAEFFGAP
jgi:D-sedoheptulose 7-phosphate isomerase